jgi:hypothetical protein
VTLAVCIGLGANAAATLGLSLRGHSRAVPRSLRTALLVGGLPASLAGTGAPLHAWAGGLDPAGVFRALYGFAFGVIPGLWCAGAWTLSRASARAPGRDGR